MAIKSKTSVKHKSAVKPNKKTISKQAQSQREAALETLRQSEERYRSILEEMQEGYFEVDLAGNFTFFNNATCRVMGYSKEEMTGMNDRQYTDKENAKILFQAFNEVYRTGEPTKEFDWQIIRKDGTKRFGEASVSLIKDSAGNPIGFRGMIRDITERKQVEEALQESEQYFKDITENSSDIIIITDEKGDIKYCSLSVERFTGYKPKELIGRNVITFIHPDDVKRAAGDFGEAILAKDSAIPNEFRILHKDGSDRYFEGLGKNLLDNPSVVGFIMNVHDITERKQADELLRKNEERYRTLVENASDIVFRTDVTGHFTFVNPATLRITGYSEEEIIGKHYKMLIRPDMFDESMKLLVSQYENRVQNTYHEFPVITKEGHEIWIGQNTQLLVEAGQVSGFQAVARDITESKQAEEKIQHMATHDALTGLPNRFMFTQLLSHSLQAAKRYQKQCAVLFMDLDRFKLINDTMGHAAGDLLLQEVAARLKQTLRAVDLVARLGGDEFVVLIEEVSNLKHLETVANKILSTVIKPMSIFGEECRVTGSIGISVFPNDADDEQTLMKNADIAMYFAKEEGKNNFQFYSTDIKPLSIERLSIESHLRHALECNEFFLHYQAKLDFKTNVITGVEALLRWNNPALGSVTPMQFIPVAEETGLIVPIGRWVLKTACAQNVAWQQQGLPPVCMAVNLSLRQLTDDNLIDDIKTVLNDSGMAPNLLELEITERMVMHNPERVIGILTRIKNMGVRLALDDFGTGYSSLAQIKHFPIDTLKVDRSFIRNIPKDIEDKAITKAIIAMGRTLSLTVVAEGVETQEQMDFLRQHSCDEMQGFYFSKPIAPKQFAELLHGHNPSLQK